MSTKIHSSAVPQKGEEAVRTSSWLSPTVAQRGTPSAEERVQPCSVATRERCSAMLASS